MRRALPLAVLALALAGCSSPELQTTGVDVERAFNAARDPWAAPTSVSFPSQEYGGANVLRDAGSRSTSYPGLGARQIARLEIAAAMKAGWTLASVACPDRELFTASLTKGENLDDTALAVLGVDEFESSVTLFVPHHLDGSWPSTTPTALEESCLSGGPKNELPTELPFDPYPGDGGSPPLEDYEPWQRDTVSDEERALLDEVLADPLLAAAGADVSISDAEARLKTGDNWRSAFSGGATISSQALTTRDSVAEVVDDSGWVLTWASCGAKIATEATMRIPAQGGTVTARLRSETPGKVTISLGLPVPEAPLTYTQVEEVPALESSRCLGSAPLDSGLVVEGVPVALPSRLHPYLGG